MICIEIGSSNISSRSLLYVTVEFYRRSLGGAVLREGINCMRLGLPIIVY